MRTSSNDGRWCADRDVSEALALTKPLPGSTVVQIVAFLGWRLGGFGCVIAAASFVTPAAIIIAIAAAAATFALPLHAGVLIGIQVGVIGCLHRRCGSSLGRKRPRSR